MHAQIAIAPLSVEDYLQQEQQDHIRHEYIEGQIFAMAGGSRAHNQITINLAALLRPISRGTNCRIYAADMKVAVAKNVFYYPDLVVTCQIAQENSEYYLSHPCLVVEVLSPSTEHIDKREKLLAYQRIPSLQAYLIIAQDKLHVEQYWRDEQGNWHYDTYTEQEIVHLPCLNLEISMNAIYEDVLIP